MKKIHMWAAWPNKIVKNFSSKYQKHKLRRIALWQMLVIIVLTSVACVGFTITLKE
jgi:hypothetical protein